MGLYAGVSGLAHKVAAAYIGVDGKARKIKKMYIGVGGVARLFYSAGSDLPENISGSVTTKGTATEIAQFTVTEACTCTIYMSNIAISGGTSSKVSQITIYSGDTSVYGVGDSSVTSHPSFLTGSTTLEAGDYTVKAACFGVTGGQSGVTYYSGSMNYGIVFS